VSDAVIEASSPVGDPVPEPAPTTPSPKTPGPEGAPKARPDDDEAAVPPLLERVEGVLGAPFETLRRHDATWGWVGPWLVVAVAGLLFGLVYLARVDVDALREAEQERAFDRMPAATRRSVEQPEVQETMKTVGKFMGFMTRVGLVLGPPILGLAGMVFAGGLVFVVALVHQKQGAKVDLARSISLAAHVGLANLVATVAGTVGALSGNPRPTASLAAFVDPFDKPAVAALLGRLDPSTVLYYVLLIAGLVGSIGLARRRALVVAFAAWLVGTLFAVGAATAAMSMGGGS
jgi:hypothetical protein